jgi:hypothetical protein
MVTLDIETSPENEVIIPNLPIKILVDDALPIVNDVPLASNFTTFIIFRPFIFKSVIAVPTHEPLEDAGKSIQLAVVPLLVRTCPFKPAEPKIFIFPT